jgi:hypothetical protein
MLKLVLPTLADLEMDVKNAWKSIPKCVTENLVDVYASTNSSGDCGRRWPIKY